MYVHKSYFVLKYFSINCLLVFRETRIRSVKFAYSLYKAISVTVLRIFFGHSLGADPD